MQKTGNLLSALSRPRLVNAVGIVLILSLLGFYIFFTRANLVTTFDDAYMFIRYANNAIAGHGIARPVEDAIGTPGHALRMKARQLQPQIA